MIQYKFIVQTDFLVQGYQCSIHRCLIDFFNLLDRTLSASFFLGRENGKMVYFSYSPVFPALQLRPTLP